MHIINNEKNARGETEKGIITVPSVRLKLDTVIGNFKSKIKHITAESAELIILTTRNRVYFNPLCDINGYI